MMKNLTGISYKPVCNIDLDRYSYLMLECHLIMKQAPAHSVITDRQQGNNAGCMSTMTAESMFWASGVCHIKEN